MEHLHKFVSEEEISTCSGFAVTFLANIKNVRGLYTTGIVGCTCSRHGVRRKCGFGNLQHGERYVSLALFLYRYLQPSQRQYNVDGIIVQVLNNVKVEVIISYNIICQWGIHFWDHMAEFPGDARLKITPEVVVMCVVCAQIPSFGTQASLSCPLFLQLHPWCWPDSWRNDRGKLGRFKQSDGFWGTAGYSGQHLWVS